MDEADHAELLRLIRGADFLIESAAPGRMKALGLDHETLAEVNPALVYVSITPFGQTGPKAGYLGTDLTQMAASGVALRLTGGTSVDEVPDSFAWLGHGAIAGLPVPVVLMLVLYGAAWFVMHHTTLGRAIYAVGSNEEAARLAGIPVERVLVLVYTACGALAGVGGLLTASTFESGDPTYGVSYELYVIAAVVVGGTSLAGGQGRVMGTLVGSLILGVIYNGMNLTNVGGFSQRIVLGLVILLAVVLDQWKRRRALAPG